MHPTNQVETENTFEGAKRLVDFVTRGMLHEGLSNLILFRLKSKKVYYM